MMNFDDELHDNFDDELHLIYTFDLDDGCMIFWMMDCMI